MVRMGDKVNGKVSFKRLELCVFLRFDGLHVTGILLPSSRLLHTSSSLTLTHTHPPAVGHAFFCPCSQLCTPQNHSLNYLHISIRPTVPVASVPRQTRPASRGPSSTTTHLCSTTRRPLLPRPSLCPPRSVKVSLALRERILSVLNFLKKRYLREVMDVLVDLIVVIMSPSGSPVTHLHPPPLLLATSTGLHLGTSRQDGYYNCLPQLTLLK